MSDYSEEWYELHKDTIEQERKLQFYRGKIINELPLDEMIKIIFTDLINRMGASDVIKLGEKYFGK